MTFHDLPRCCVTTCDRPAETCGYCVPCWVRMDLEGVPDDAPDVPPWFGGGLG